MDKRILIITKNFPPTAGGLERMMGEVYRKLSGRTPTDLIAPCGARAWAGPGGTILECPLRPLSLFFLCALARGVVHMFHNRPDLCLAGSGLSAPVAVLLGRLYRVPVMVFVHGLDLVYPNPVYQHLFLPFVVRADRIIANSGHTARLAAEKGVPDDRIRVLNPGTWVPEPVAKRPQIAALANLPGGKILLSVGRLVPRKGITEFLERAWPAVQARHPDAVFVIAGPDPDAGGTASVSRAVADRVRERDWARQVLLLGEQGEAELQELYRRAKVFVFPLIAIPGDVEGFGMVAIEAAAHGLPTVAFAEGGVTDAVAPGRSGLLIEPGDYAGMAEAICRLFEDGYDAINAATCRGFAADFTWERFGGRLQRLLEEPLG